MKYMNQFTFVILATLAVWGGLMTLQAKQRMWATPYIIYLDKITVEDKVRCLKDPNCNDILLTEDLPMRKDIDSTSNHSLTKEDIKSLRP